MIAGVAIGIVIVAMAVLWLSAEQWRLLRPSTRQLFREGGWRRFFNLSSAHGYLYLRWTGHYINALINLVAPVLGTPAVNWLADRYHGKALTPDQAKAIISLDRDILQTDLEQIVPYPTARKLVLHGPPDLLLTECPCRSFRDDPCQPTQVCMIIGQPFVNFKLEHNPRTSRLVTREEALKLLEEEYERGHMHSAWFRDVALDRFFSICNCCKCCCAGIEGMVKYGSPLMVSSGYVAEVDEDECAACGTCVDLCPFDSASLNDSVAVVDWEKCLGYGVCEGQCPNDAASLRRDEAKGLSLDVRTLASG
jgi:NAD-dependent dihydropyrimidine dehydrogenase PreA subunit